ncbi:MBL fold metallo-hydrolase [Aerococcaceae bacterium WGS1372]
MEIFANEYINKHIIRIKMPYVCAYIIKGNDRAVLIDTGFGYGDLRSYVESLIELPYDVIATHGHPDHIGGNMQWNRAFLPEKEVHLEAYGGKVSTRHLIMNRVMKKEGLYFDKESFLPYKKINYMLYNEFDEFNLGGITLIPIHLPGHTQGIMTFLIPELKTLLTGDACSNPTYSMWNLVQRLKNFDMH